MSASSVSALPPNPIDLGTGGEDAEGPAGSLGSMSLLAPFGAPRPERGELIIIVGEPGMGKSDLARRLVTSTKFDPTAREELYILGPCDDLKRRLEDLRRQAVSRAHRLAKKRVRVLIDGFPSVEEDVLVYAVEKIRAMTTAGCGIVVTLRPEAEQLLDALPEARAVRNANLLYRLPQSPSAAALSMWERTNGVPMLVNGLLGKAGPSLPHYVEGLCRLIKESLRSGIPQGERELRMAMMLLGKGTFSDLEDITLGADGETLAWLANGAPLFGIDLFGSTFSCAGLADDELMRACYGSLRSESGTFGAVEERAFEVLLGRGEYVRASICSALIPQSDRRCRATLRQGVELCLSGGAAVVGDSIKTAQTLCLQEEPGYTESAVALSVLDASVARARQKMGGLASTPPLAGGSRRRRSHLELMMTAREVDAGGGRRRPYTHARDVLSEHLVEHVAARQLLLNGQASRAMEMLSDMGSHGRPTTIPEALLCDDALIANALCTMQPGPQAREVIERSQKLVQTSHLHRLSVYERALPDFLAVIMGGTGSLSIDQAIVCAERSGDLALRAVFLIAAAIADVRRSALATAHVRLTRAVDAGAKTSFVFLTDCARLVDALVLTMLGEEGAIVALDSELSNHSVIKDLAQVVAGVGADPLSRRMPDATSPDRQGMRTSGGAAGTEVLSMLDRAHLSRDVLWLVWTLSKDFGRVSTSFYRGMPRAWRRAIGRYAGTLSPSPRRRDRIAPPPGASGRLDAPKGPRVDPESMSIELSAASEPSASTVEPKDQEALRHCVQMRLLGSFEVRVDGEMVNQDHLSRRKSRMLLALLAATQPHELRRGDLAEAIWPEEAAERSRQRLYESISGARKAMGAHVMGFDPFVIDRARGTIGLNADVVSIDVDNFERAAHACAASDGDDPDVIAYACEARDLYTGSFDSSAAGGVPWVEERREGLREELVDTMVSGARAALREERSQLAVALAQVAANNDEMREDVASTYIECLCATDRQGEAREAYLHFSAHIVSVTGMAPSRDLRTLAASLMPKEAIAGEEPFQVYEGEVSGTYFDEQAGASR